MDTWVNPATGDYVYQAGAYVRDPANGLANAVYLRLMTPLATWWADPTLGSRLHELQREKDVARVALLAKQYSEQALQPILDDGRARAIVVTTERVKDASAGGRLQLSIAVTDAGGRALTFVHPIKVA
jgi:phage gp46-like protein